MNQVLKDFINLELDDYARRLILSAVKKHGNNPGLCREGFEFNVFDVTLDFEKEQVLLENVLEPPGSGFVELELSRFIAIISERGTQ